MYSKKKRVDVHGTLAAALAIGSVAFINVQNGDAFRTSAVKHFIQLPFGIAYIQTENTHYYLHPPVREGAAKGVQA